MKKIKIINKLLSSLTLLSPLSGIGFNNQYQNTQKVITENNNKLKNYFNLVNNQRTMGEVTVNVEGTILTSYVSGEGELIIDSDITEIAQSCFEYKRDLSLTLDLSRATSLTTISNDAFTSCTKLTGDLVIPSSVTNIGTSAFSQTGISSLDLSQATSLATIGQSSFQQLYLSGDLIIPSNVTSIEQSAFSNSTIDNLIFTSETPPTSFGASWQPTLTGKVYVPSEQAKSKYTSAQNFGFNQDQVEIGLPPEPSKSNTGLILGLILGLGIPIVLAVGFGVWYLTKKKKTKVKI